MNKEHNQMSLVELAEELLLRKKKPHTFQSIFKEVCEMKGLTEEEANNIISQFYTDFISCAKFVYCGEDLWDLKSRQSLDSMAKEFNSEHKDYLEDFLTGGKDDDDEEEEYEKDKDNDEDSDEDIDEDDEDNDEDSLDDDDVEEDDVEEDDFDADDVEEYDNKEKPKKFVSDFDTEEEDEYEGYDEDEYIDIMDDYEDLYDK